MEELRETPVRSLGDFFLELGFKEFVCMRRNQVLIISSDNLDVDVILFPSTEKQWGFPLRVMSEHEGKPCYMPPVVKIPGSYLAFMEVRRIRVGEGWSFFFKVVILNHREKKNCFYDLAGIRRFLQKREAFK